MHLWEQRDVTRRLELTLRSDSASRRATRAVDQRVDQIVARAGYVLPGQPRRRLLGWWDSHLPEVPPAMTPDGEMLGGASVTGQTTTANSPRADLLITKTPESGCVFPGASLPHR
jgi:hypothetical protein